MKTRYTRIRIGGIGYHVVNNGCGEEQRDVAIKLSKINRLAVKVMGYMRRYIVKSESSPSFRDHMDRTLGFERLRIAWNRLRFRYSVESVYEVPYGEGEVSYVKNLGEEVHYCVRNESRSIIITVLAHELAHVISPTPHHDKFFEESYRFMTKLFGMIGFMTENEIPKSGGIHCGKVSVSPEEMKLVSYKPMEINEEPNEALGMPFSDYVRDTQSAYSRSPYYRSAVADMGSSCAGDEWPSLACALTENCDRLGADMPCKNIALPEDHGMLYYLASDRGAVKEVPGHYVPEKVTHNNIGFPSSPMYGNGYYGVQKGDDLHVSYPVNEGSTRWLYS